MTIRTVGDLIATLEELPEDMPILAVHQFSWPLLERIGGVWVDDGSDDEDDGCEECGEPRLSIFRDSVYKCHECGAEREAGPARERVAHIVLNGHPDGNPYGNKRAWDEI